MHKRKTNQRGKRRPKREIVAYIVSDENLKLVPAPRNRAWMDSTDQHFANRCLPLLIANQSGWFMLNQHEIEAVWDGGTSKESVKLTPVPGGSVGAAVSHFGHGIVTWHIPYLFRTPSRFSLLARGPSNWPKDGACPLEGLVESDWAAATFTMNWQLTRPNLPVGFLVGEPICMILPQRRGELESFRPIIKPLTSDSEVRDGYQAWSASRSQFNQMLNDPASAAVAAKWEKHYFRGVMADGRINKTHCVKRVLADFSPA